jgi:hypothetical protein
VTRKGAKKVRRAHLRSVVGVSSLSLIVVIVVVFSDDVVFLVHPLIVFF